MISIMIIGSFIPYGFLSRKIPLLTVIYNRRVNDRNRPLATVFIRECIVKELITIISISIILQAGLHRLLQFI